MNTLNSGDTGWSCSSQRLSFEWRPISQQRSSGEIPVSVTRLLLKAKDWTENYSQTHRWHAGSLERGNKYIRDSNWSQIAKCKTLLRYNFHYYEGLPTSLRKKKKKKGKEEKRKTKKSLILAKNKDNFSKTLQHYSFRTVIFSWCGLVKFN